tara:strand:- start:434 stop:1393 length:960 start_codon:yes stop_codon:yes gene_type:complete
MKIGGAKNKLFPTDTGIFINKFLLSHFSNIMDYGFTAHVETLLDEIANGKHVWYGVVQGVYDEMNPIIVRLQPSLDPKNGGGIERDKYERLLGTDPKSGREIAVYLSRNGPVAVSRDPNNKNHKYAGLEKYDIKKIKLKEALHLLRFPYVIGKYKNKDIEINNGRYGRYLKYNGSNYALKYSKDIIVDMNNVTLEEATIVIKNKDDKIKKTIIKKIGNDIIIKNGQYGPYISYKGDINVKIPKSINPEEITLKKCEEIIAAKKTRGRGGRAGKGAKPNAAKSKVVKPKTKPKAKATRAKKAVAKPKKKAVRRKTKTDDK